MMSQIQDFKEKIKTAEKAVENITDDALKTKAFEIILKELLSEMPVMTHRPNIITETSSHDKIRADEATYSPVKLTEALKLNVDQIRRVIDFSNDKFHIIAPIPGGTEGEKQRNAALIFLTVNYYCRNVQDATAGELKRMFINLGIGSIFNMATNLTVKSHKQYFVKEGERSSKGTTYKITMPGIQKGSELIRYLAKQSNIGDVESSENDKPA